MLGQFLHVMGSAGDTKSLAWLPPFGGMVSLMEEVELEPAQPMA
jgi:hypothetical protein